MCHNTKIPSAIAMIADWVSFIMRFVARAIAPPLLVLVVCGMPVAVKTPVGKLVDLPLFGGFVEDGTEVIILVGAVPGTPAIMPTLGLGGVQSVSLLYKTPLMMTPASLASIFFASVSQVVLAARVKQVGLASGGAVF